MPVKIPRFVKHHYKKILIALIVAGIAGGWYYNYQQKAAQEALESTTVQRGTLTQTLTLSGEVSARESTTLHFQTGGKLSSLAVKDGDIVKKGQFIASLDQRQLQKSLEKDLNTFLKARWDLDQLRDDNDDVVADEAVKRIIDKAQFDVNNTILDVEIQSIAKEYANIFAPISGIVTTTHNNFPGQNVGAATAIVDIVNPDTIYFALTADQTEVSSLREGMEGTLVLDAFTDKELRGTISRVAFTPKEGETSTVYEVLFTFMQSSNSELAYKSGMTGDVDFVTQEKTDALYIPLSYITERGGKTYVRVMENGEIVERTVTTGIEAETDIEVTSGLKEGEIIYD